MRVDTEERAHVYAIIGVHAGVEITLTMDRPGESSAEIHIGREGPDLTMDFADAESLERLAAVAADGARRLRDRVSDRASGDGIDGIDLR